MLEWLHIRTDTQCYTDRDVLNRWTQLSEKILHICVSIHKYTQKKMKNISQCSSVVHLSATKSSWMQLSGLLIDMLVFKCVCKSHKRICLFLYSFKMKAKCQLIQQMHSLNLVRPLLGSKEAFFLSLAFFFLLTTWHNGYPQCNSTADNSVRDLGALWVQLLKPGAARLKELATEVTYNSTPPRCFF